MASLTGNKIKDTYEGLLKTSDNANLGATSKVITDGEGNESGLSLDTNGNVDVSNDLSVGGDLTLNGAIIDGNGSAGSAGQILSSTVTGTDWISLSEIQGVDGTGTANKVSKWLDAETITDSSITDNGSLVSIANPLSVTGSVTATTLVKSGGVSSEFLKADGSVDSTVYATEADLTTAEGRISTNESDIAAIEAKTDFITVTQPVDLDAMESGISTNAGNIATNTSDISGLDSRLTTAEGDIDANTTAIAGKVSKTGDTMTGNLTAPSFIKTGGTSSQFLKADGSVDSNTYVTSGDINLSNTPAANSVDVEISGGTDTTIAAATTSLAGVMSASDKTKLDGIEAGAEVNTVDSVNGQVGVVVLNADDISDAATTNKFTTAADISKLAGIEAGADVTDATNVAAAGAMMTNVAVLNDLSNVSGTPSNGQVLAFDSVNGWQPANAAGGAVDSVNGQTGVVVLSTSDLDDVSATAPTDGQVLRFNNTLGVYVPETLSSTAPVDSVNGQTGAVVLDADDISDAATTNKFTTASDISKLAGIEAGAQVNTVDSVNSLTGAVVLDTDDISDAASVNKYTTASDISKLAGIEAGAQVNTVDSVNSQTGAVVLDADDIDDTATTNKFTTASDISKLAGIEAGADVTDATNVAAAGAMMTGTAVLNDLSNVSGTPTDGQILTYDSVNGWQPENAPAAGVTSVNGQTGVVVLDADDIDDSTTTNKFTTAGDISKLAGIESGADVTDSTNVVSSLVGATAISAGDKTTIQTNIDVDPAGTDNSVNVTLAGSYDYLTLVGQQITLNQIDYSTDISNTPTIPNAPAIENNAGTPQLATGITAAEVRTVIDVDVAGTDNSTPVTLSGSYDYLSLSDQTITLNQVDLTTDVTGTLPIANGGTGSTTASGSLANLGGDTKYTVSVISGNTTAQKDYLYIATASLTLTLPATPTAGDKVGVSNMSGTTTLTIGRNGENIAALAEDLTINVDNIGLQLYYTGATKGWILI